MWNTPAETTPGCCVIWGHRRWYSFYEDTPDLLQSDKLPWRLTCDQVVCIWSLEIKNDITFHWHRNRLHEQLKGKQSHNKDVCMCFCLCASLQAKCWGFPGELTVGRSTADECWCPPERQCRGAVEYATCWPPGEIQRSSEMHLQIAGVLPWSLRKWREETKVRSSVKPYGWL